MHRRQTKQLTLEPLDCRLLFSQLGFADPIPVSPVDATNFAAVADFNNDGKLDCVGSSFSGSALTILLGTGKGGFRTKSRIEFNDGPDFVASADLDADHIADLITVTFSGNRISVLLGNGDGTFRRHASFAAPGARALVLGDFTGDSITDLALAKSFASGVTILPGLGHGAFGAPIDQSFDFIPSDLVAGDFDKNGTLDLAAVDFFTDTLHVLKNTGGGQFQLGQSVATGLGPSAIATGDLNTDGKLDLATANFLGGGVTVLLGNGDGSFGSPSPIQSGRGATFVLAADVDHDSKQDLLVANALDDTVTAFVSNGDGTFQAPVDFATGKSPRSIALGKFNGDSRIDFVVSNEDSQSLTAVISDTKAPVASMPKPLLLSAAGGAFYDFTVTYRDNLVFGDTSLDDGDVTVSGPHGFFETASFVSSKQVNVATRLAKYRIAAPGGFWEPKDNGAYSVSLIANAVFDTTGNAVPPTDLGDIDVGITDVGNGTKNATTLGSIRPGRVRAKSEYVGVDDRNDFYRFNVTKSADVYIKLSKLADDADLQLLNAKGSRIGYSKRSGSAVEFVRKNLSPGTYYARVIFSHGKSGTGYRLRLEASAPLPPPTNNSSLRTATNLGPLSPAAQCLSIRASESTIGMTSTDSSLEQLLEFSSGSIN